MNTVKTSLVVLVCLEILGCRNSVYRFSGTNKRPANDSEDFPNYLGDQSVQIPAGKSGGITIDDLISVFVDEGTFDRDVILRVDKTYIDAESIPEVSFGVCGPAVEVTVIDPETSESVDNNLVFKNLRYQQSIPAGNVRRFDEVWKIEDFGEVDQRVRPVAFDGENALDSLTIDPVTRFPKEFSLAVQNSHFVVFFSCDRADEFSAQEPALGGGQTAVPVAVEADQTTEAENVAVGITSLDPAKTETIIDNIDAGITATDPIEIQASMDTTPFVAPSLCSAFYTDLMDRMLSPATADSTSCLVSASASLLSLQAGSTAVTVNASQVQTIEEGSYGAVTVNSYSTLHLKAGTYTFKSLFIGSYSNLIADGEVVINVTGNVTMTSYSKIKSATDMNNRICGEFHGTVLMTSYNEINGDFYWAGAATDVAYNRYFGHIWYGSTLSKDNTATMQCQPL